MSLLSLNLGQPELLPDPFAREGGEPTHRTAIRKRPAEGPVWLGRLGLAGDEVADHRHHGGPDQAVLAYAGVHYATWRAELGDHPVLLPGGFGENLTVEGTDETTACLGDVWEIGGARLEVSLPRMPCETLARRFGIRDFVKRVARCGRTGWYLRVLREGLVEAGTPVTLLERPFPAWTVVQAFRVMLDARAPEGLRRELASCPALAEKTRRRLASGG
ncbi:MAG TPA: MOSC domain-containing protein [Gemmatimonadales bacterium]|nr:MOSC domain-containing protein [Gemmatimonadales bacterium]